MRGVGVDQFFGVTGLVQHAASLVSRGWCLEFGVLKPEVERVIGAVEKGHDQRRGSTTGAMKLLNGPGSTERLTFFGR